ncbi:HAD family hydrolase, partial [Campylobacter concisus]
FNDVLVNRLLEYHSLNGGLSRYVKIRYFYNAILGIDVSDEKVQELASKFSYIMKTELTNKKYLITETVEFIKQNYKKYNFHIVSGSDEKELNYLCEKLDLSKFFKTIEGSPTPKNELVKNVLRKYNYNSNECILIGDSVNDYEAAYLNKIKFYGYNNEKLKNKADYIEDFYIFKIKE